MRTADFQRCAALNACRCLKFGVPQVWCAKSVVCHKCGVLECAAERWCDKLHNGVVLKRRTRPHARPYFPTS